MEKGQTQGNMRINFKCYEKTKNNKKILPRKLRNFSIATSLLHYHSQFVMKILPSIFSRNISSVDGCRIEYDGLKINGELIPE